VHVAEQSRGRFFAVWLSGDQGQSDHRDSGEQYDGEWGSLHLGGSGSVGLSKGRKKTTQTVEGFLGVPSAIAPQRFFLII
jgi:hypothetical protein